MNEVTLKIKTVLDSKGLQQAVKEIDGVKSATQQAGFDIEELSAKPMTRIPELFYYAFKMHHAFINKKETDRILAEEFGGLKEEELVRLAELYSAPYNTLVFTEEDGEEKNVRRVTIL